jgi:hypothetical protein
MRCGRGPARSGNAGTTNGCCETQPSWRPVAYISQTIPAGGLQPTPNAAPRRGLRELRQAGAALRPRCLAAADHHASLSAPRLAPR